MAGRDRVEQSIERASQWLGARPHRATVINVAMLSAILAMVSSASLYLVVGGGAVMLAGGYVLLRAARRTLATRASLNLYQLALLWMPGILAVCLALVALHLVTTMPVASLAYGLGALLFAAEMVMLVLAGADLSSDPAQIPGAV
jgi:hypothetical protein